nr:hemolysin III family protein [uncultured Sphaerochaeta sp.]
MQRFNAWLEDHITLHSYDDPKAEKENAITHVVGAALALIALISILFKLPSLASTSFQVGLVIWGLTMLLLYSSSALYHSLPHGNGKRLCRVLGS